MLEPYHCARLIGIWIVSWLLSVSLDIKKANTFGLFTLQFLVECTQVTQKFSWSFMPEISSKPKDWHLSIKKQLQLRGTNFWPAESYRQNHGATVNSWSTRTGSVHLEHHSSKRCCLSFDDCGRESCLTWQTKIAMRVWVEIWELWRPYSIICIVFMFIKPFRKPLWMGTLPSWKRINNDQSELILHWHFLLSGRVTTNHVHKTSPKAQQSHWTYAL